MRPKYIKPPIKILSTDYQHRNKQQVLMLFSLTVFEDIEDISPGKRLVVRRLSDIPGQLLLDELTLLLVEPLDFLGEVGDRKEPNKGDDASQ